RRPRERRHGHALAHGLRRVQALHARRLPGRLPDRLAVPHRVRHRRRPGGHLQRVRLLHPGLSVRRDRPAQGRRPGVEVHAVLRPDRRRARAGVREGVPDRLDPVRPARRAARTRRAARRAAPRPRRGGRAPLRPRPERRRRRRRRVLPAAGRAGGVRAAARPGRHHPRPAVDREAHGPGGGRPPRRYHRRLRRPRPQRRRAMSEMSEGNESRVTREGVQGERPDREAQIGKGLARRNGGRRGRRAEKAMVPEAEFSSYYGLPILNPPVWKSLDIAGYFFLGGVAGAGSVLAAGAQLTGRRAVARALKISSLAAIAGSTAALIDDLGRPARFVNMLRVMKLTSPMSMGSWLLAAYGPAAGAAAVLDVTGLFPRLGGAATAGAAALGPLVATYTAALAADTAVPAWHDVHRELPMVFAGSATTAASGAALLACPVRETAPMRTTAVLGAALELAAAKWMEHRAGLVAEP